MKFDKKHLTLYAVTDRAWTGGSTLYEQVEEALAGGITCLQLREKELDESAFMKEAAEIRRLCSAYGVPFIVNDNIDIALRCRADGVHIGQQDMDAAEARRKIGSMILGVSANTVQSALAAQAAGADYLGVGAVFPTGTKKDADHVGLEELTRICSAADIPAVAIGGICADNIMTLRGTGAAGIAVVSAIFSAEDIRNECQKLRALSEKMTD